LEKYKFHNPQTSIGCEKNLVKTTKGGRNTMSLLGRKESASEVQT